MFKGSKTCDIVEKGRTFHCFIVHGGKKKTRVVRCGLDRDMAVVLPNDRILNATDVPEVSTSKIVDDGKVFNSTAVYADEKVYLVKYGSKNSRICPIEGTGRVSFLVPTKDLAEVEKGVSGSKAEAALLPTEWDE